MHIISVSKEALLEYAALHRDARAGRTPSAAGSLQEWLAETGRGDGVPYLKGLNLRGADLSFADLNHAHIEGCTLEGALLDQADFSHAIMPSNCFVGVSAKGTSFGQAQMEKVNFNRAKLVAAGPLARRDMCKTTDFSGAMLKDATFNEAHCRNVFFTAADLEGASFNNTMLENTSFRHANLVAADFSESHPYFREAVSTRAYPVGVEMDFATVIGTKGMEVFAGHAEQAIQTPDKLASALERMAAMGQGGAPLPSFLQQQAESRRSAAQSVIDSGGGNAVLECALQRLNAAIPRPGGFAAQEKSREARSFVRSEVGIER